MFRQFYNMASNPFTKEVPASSAFQTEGMRQVHARLEHLSRIGGMGLVTAEPGAGKTIAVRTWAAKSNPNTAKVVYICMSTVTNMEFYRMLCRGLGLEPGYKKADMFADIQARIRSLVDEKRMRVTVVLDEAQYLSGAILKDLQMLANFDMDSRDMFSLVLVGHPHLAQTLARQPYESLRQRLSVSYRMEALTAEQARDYVRDRLLLAGADPDIFDDAALACAHGCCGGSVRRLNSIVVNALTIGAQQQARAIDAEMVRSAAEELVLS